PVLYAALGACVFIFRSWCSEHRRNNANSRWDHASRRTTNPHWPDHITRVLMACIAGIAIGAVNGLFPKEMLLPPLALAFVVGYSIEIFTSQVDAMIKKLKKEKAEVPTLQHAD